ncbi:hypothetical protein EPJ74_07670 [Brachyspira aalborgi]|uniref:DUF5678 domain-containing protein n=1 Tax=Brachyspira aalborgi TaxID=29522 RepID=A0A5C8EIX2_9SPIR|nr:hypothetical protein [Brachyspira aalborgi]TXJ37889.1 hypothetical protein EPJ78_04040 [Brachyspira aalborgi]TXJ52486.1 hypothetical protein EPJ84_02365 [Brachyspira aalborgi]TXJ60079.1 hypothetical protein EPJ74_07670 [Brachyspira aalborgi]
MNEPTLEEVQKEIDKNYDFFLKELPNIINLYNNKYALLKNAEIIDYFDTMDDAIKYAKIRFEDGLYSIQKVNETPVSLGYIGSFLNA